MTAAAFSERAVGMEASCVQSSPGEGSAFGPHEETHSKRSATLKTDDLFMSVFVQAQYITKCALGHFAGGTFDREPTQKSNRMLFPNIHLKQ